MVMGSFFEIQQDCFLCTFCIITELFPGTVNKRLYLFNFVMK
jgi:hypothetical protein